MSDILQILYIENGEGDEISNDQKNILQQNLFEQQVFSLGQSNFHMNDVLLLQMDQMDNHEDKQEANITSSTYCNTNIQQSESNIQLQFQSVKEDVQIKKDSNYYIGMIQKKLKKKMNQNHEKKAKIKEKIKQKKNLNKQYKLQKNFIQMSPEQIPKTKKINKTKKKLASVKILSQQLGIAKKHLSKLWCSKIIYFLRPENTNKQAYKNIPQVQIQQIKRFLSKTSMTIKQLSYVLRNNQWLRKLIYDEEIKDDKPLELIYNASNLTEQSKLIMLQTYDMFKQAVINPNIQITWDPIKRKKMNQSQLLVQKCKNKSLQAISNILNEQYEKQMQDYSKNKCSKQNNISYCWYAYIKDVANQAQFLSNVKNQQHLQILKDLLQKPASITNIKRIFELNQFSQYILNQKINKNGIIQQILVNNKFNILNKKNMVQSYLSFCSAALEPQSLKNWPKISN